MASSAYDFENDLAKALQLSLELSKQAEAKQKTDEPIAAQEEKERFESELQRKIAATRIIESRKADEQRAREKNAAKEIHLDPAIIIQKIRSKEEVASRLWTKICEVNAKVSVGLLMLKSDETTFASWERDLQRKEEELTRKADDHIWAIRNLKIESFVQKYKDDYNTCLMLVKGDREHLRKHRSENRQKKLELSEQQRKLDNLKAEHNDIKAEIAPLKQKLNAIKEKEREIQSAALKQQQIEREESERIESEKRAIEQQKQDEIEARARLERDTKERIEREAQEKLKAEQEAREKAEQDAKAAMEEKARIEAEKLAIEQVPTLVEASQENLKNNRELVAELATFQRDLKAVVETQQFLDWLDQQKDLLSTEEQRSCKAYLKEAMLEQSEKLTKESEALLGKVPQRIGFSENLQFRINQCIENITSDDAYSWRNRLRKLSSGEYFTIEQQLHSTIDAVKALLKQLPAEPSPPPAQLFLYVDNSASIEREKEAKRRREEEQRQYQERYRILELLWRQRYLEACRLKAEQKKKLEEARQQRERELTLLRQLEQQRKQKELELEAEQLEQEKAARVVRYNYA